MFSQTCLRLLRQTPNMTSILSIYYTTHFIKTHEWHTPQKWHWAGQFPSNWHAAISPKWGAAELIRLSQLGGDMQWSGSVLPVPTAWPQPDLLLAMVLLKKALQWALQNILGKLCSTCCRLQMTAGMSLFTRKKHWKLLTCVVLHSAGCWFFVFVCWTVA